MMNLYPQVKSFKMLEGTSSFTQGYLTSQKYATLYKKDISFLPLYEIESQNVSFSTNHNLHPEGYVLHIENHHINIESCTSQGELWAIKTLKQIIKQYLDDIPNLHIEDEPVLNVRGFMLDVSRNKIPKLKTIFSYIDMLSDLKMNHFELYIEGFSYRYPSFPDDLYEGLEPLTESDFKKVDVYASKKGIEFVLNHNTFGHMNAWLSKDKYKDLAIMKDGMMMWGWKQSASTLNPLNKESRIFIKRLIDDAVKGSQSKYFNICFDEAYELGHGPTEEACQKEGIETIFLDYLNEIVNHLKSHQKIALMWGDFFVHHPHAIQNIPKDVIVIDWGYDRNYPFNETLKQLSKHHVPFISAPGTSSWNSLTGRTIDMLENVQKSIEYTKKFNGLGTILTDWGDNGHLQYPIISHPAIVYTALESWSDHTGNQALIRSYLNTYIYQDDTLQLGDLNIDLGRYQRFQKTYLHNGTELIHVLGTMHHAAQQDNPWQSFYDMSKHFDYTIHTLKRMKNEFEWMKKTVDDVKKTISNHVKKIDVQEFYGSINHVLLAIEMLLQARLKTYKLPIWMKKIPSQHQTTWLYKNKRTGLDYSLNILKSVERFYAY